jgi:hypothetical protein
MTDAEALLALERALERRQRTTDRRTTYRRADDRFVIVRLTGGCMATVPNLISLGAEEAKDAVDAAGLTRGTMDANPALPHTNLVCAQSPAPDSTVDPGSAVQVTLRTTPQGLSAATVIWGY